MSEYLSHPCWWISLSVCDELCFLCCRRRIIEYCVLKYKAWKI